MFNVSPLQQQHKVLSPVIMRNDRITLMKWGRASPVSGDELSRTGPHLRRRRVQSIKRWVVNNEQLLIKVYCSVEFRFYLCCQEGRSAAELGSCGFYYRRRINSPSPNTTRLNTLTVRTTQTSLEHSLDVLVLIRRRTAGCTLCILVSLVKGWIRWF